MDGARSTAISDTTRTEGLSALDSSLLLLRAPLLTFPRQALRGPFLFLHRGCVRLQITLRPHSGRTGFPIDGLQTLSQGLGEAR